jgi:hypothetical protein
VALMLVSQGVSITLPAHEWLQIVGWLMGQPHRPGVSNHLIDAVGQVVLKRED